MKPTMGGKTTKKATKKETGLIPPAYGRPEALTGPALKMRRSKVEGLTGQGGSHSRRNITPPYRKTGMALTHGAKGKRYRGMLPGFGKVGTM